MGTIENNKVADLVLLEANPLEDINNTKKIAAVLAGGKLYKKNELQEILNRIEARANESKKK
jgi:imidazolonepropionase-like amidohydrolase